MSIEKIWGLQSEGNEILSKNFVKALDECFPEAEGTLYLSFPVIVKGNSSVDAFLLLEGKYPIIFAFANSGNIDLDYIEGHLDDSYKTLEAKFKDSSLLTDGRHLKFEIKTIAYCPGALNDQSNRSDIHYVTQNNSIMDIINMPEYDFEDFDNLKDEMESVLQNLNVISKVGDDIVSDKEDVNLYSKIKNVRDKIATFDKDQKKVAIESYDGVQRIRGLAGTGKTVILAWKAAYLHVSYPEWDIAVSFKSRGLKNIYKEFITSFCMEFVNKQPNFDKVHIINAWGSKADEPNEQGLYLRYCNAHNIAPIPFAAAKSQTSLDAAFDFVCNDAIEKSKGKKNENYDAILIDEAQDFPESFLKLTYSFLRRPKRLIFAYDDWQNLNNSKTLPALRHIFGSNVRTKQDEYGRNPDLVLNVCYRTPRPTLVVAHGIGCGVYNEKGFVQMLSPATYWEKLGYENQTGRLAKGSPAILHRSSDTSPRYLEKISEEDDYSDILDFQKFSDIDGMHEEIFNRIISYLEEGIPAEEIMVIVPNPFQVQEQINGITEKLNDRGIPWNEAGFKDSNVFKVKGQITFTHVYRAKGNEALAVFLMSADKCMEYKNPVEGRNIIFTSMTRTHCFMHVYGIGENMDKLIQEKKAIVHYDFTLKFKYPTNDEMKKMHQIGDDEESEKDFEEFSDELPF